MGHTGLKVHAVSAASASTCCPGETLGLVGESGCGKSTTGRAVMQLPRPTRGSVTFEGRELTTSSTDAMRAARTRMQMIFQDPISSLNPRRKVGDIVAEPLNIWKRGSKSERSDKVRKALEDVGIDPTRAAESQPHQFSGGQCQRISIARALVLEPTLIICDEPVSALDVSVQAQVLNLLEDLKAEYGLTMIFIAHDLAVVKNISDRVAVMYLGKLCEVAPSDALYARPAHPYTNVLLASIPHADPDAEIGDVARRGRAAVTGGAAHRLPFPPALPQRPGPLPHRGAADAGDRGRPLRRLPLPGPRRRLIAAEGGPVVRALASRPAMASGSAAAERQRPGHPSRFDRPGSSVPPPYGDDRSGHRCARRAHPTCVPARARRHPRVRPDRRAALPPQRHVVHRRRAHRGDVLHAVGVLDHPPLIDDWQRDDQIRLGAFYERRFRRLMPSAVILLLAVAVMWTWFPGNGRRLGVWEWFSGLAYFENTYLQASGKDYGGLFGLANPLQHLWSLSLEEQVYLVFPILLIGLLAGVRRLASRHGVAVLWWTAGVLTALAVVGFALGPYYESHGPLWGELPGLDPKCTGISCAYYATEVRGAEFLVGAVLAIVVTAAAGAPRLMATLRRPGWRAVGWLALAFEVWLWWQVGYANDFTDWFLPWGVLVNSLNIGVLILFACASQRPAALPDLAAVHVGRRARLHDLPRPLAAVHPGRLVAPATRPPPPAPARHRLDRGTEHLGVLLQGRPRARRCRRCCSTPWRTRFGGGGCGRAARSTCGWR